MFTTAITHHSQCLTSPIDPDGIIDMLWIEIRLG